MTDLTISIQSSEICYLVFKLSFRLESHCLDVVMLHIWFNHLLNNLLLVFPRMYHKLVSILELTWHYINTVNFNFLCYKILIKIQFWSSTFGHKNVFRSGVIQMWYLITLKSFLILKTNICLVCRDIILKLTPLRKKNQIAVNVKHKKFRV